MVRRTVITCSIVLLAAAGLSAPEDRRLADAAERGDAAAVRLLLQEKAEVNAAQGDGMTALHWAIYRDDLDMARSLIAAGADTNALNRLRSLTPLLIASTNGSAPAIQLLLNAGAEPNLGNAEGTTPLMLASAAGGTEAVTVLLNGGADVNAHESSRDQTPLMFAAALNRADVIRLLARHGASLNVTSRAVPMNANLTDEDGNPTPAASRTGATKVKLRGEGKVAGMGGMTALHYAAREGHLDASRALIESGAGVNIVNPLDKSSALVIAISNGHYDLAKYLLDHAANPNLATVDGLAALYAVVESRWAPVSWTPTAFTSSSGITQQNTGYLDLMTAVLDHGADPNAKINKVLWFDPPHHNEAWIKAAGTTAFWRAAQATDLDAMKLLVTRGADPKIASEDGTTPLAVAAGVGWAGNYSTNAPDLFLPAVKYLVEDIGIDVDAADTAGYTAVMGAAYRGDNPMVEYLVAKGASLQRRTQRDWSVTDMANGPYLRSSFPVPHPETVALLRKLGAPGLTKVEDEEILGVIKRKTPGQSDAPGAEEQK